jgi:hypothetical protein
MILTVSLAFFGAALAAPFVVAILRADTPGRVLRIWLVQLAAALALWGLLALIFHSGLITRQDLRILAAVVLNAVWVGLVLAMALGAAAAVVRAVRLRARLRTNGK